MAVNTKKTVLSALFAAAFALTSVFAPVAALEGSHNVQISPPTQKLALNPGEVYEGSFKVSNIGTETFHYTLDAVPYSVVGDNYDPDYTTENSYNQMYKWVEFDKEEDSIDPNETQVIGYTITVPDDVPAGGQYAALTTSVVNNSGSLETISRVAMIAYARVAGETREEGQILENKVSGIVFGGGKISGTSLIENTGNVHGEAVATLKVFPLGSDEEVYSTEEDPTDHIIMPETKRYNTESWEDTPSIGLYTVEHTVEFLGQTSTTRKLVLVCPLWLLVVFIALVFAIVFTLISRARARKVEAAESTKSDRRNHED